ncbi:MAG: MlaD family protein [Gammaproteobacteria bacterium]
MKRDNINYLVVGCFVLLLAMLFFYMLLQLTGRTGAADNYTVTYENVTGLKFGTPVFYEGYQVGQVETIEPQRTDAGMRYLLELSIRSGWAIPDDSIAQITASGLLAAMSIEIREGSSRTMLEPGAELTGREAVDMFAAVNDVAADFQSLSRDSIRPLLDTLNRNVEQLTQEWINLTNEDIRPLVRNFSEAFGDGKFASDINQLLASLNTSASNLEQVLSSDNVDQTSVMLSNLQESSAYLNGLLIRIDETRTRMDSVLVGVDNLVEDSSIDARAVMQELRSSLQQVAGSIDSITYHLESSSRNLNAFTRQVRSNPAVLLRSQPSEDDFSSEGSVE